MEKLYRYDGIFSSDDKKLDVVSSKMIGTNAYPMDADVYANFMRLLSVKNGGKPRSQTYHTSDQFGVMTEFFRH